MISLVAAVVLIAQGTQDLRVQRAIVVQPETVTVGDPFRVIVRVRAPRGADIGFPDAPDSAGAVEPIDPVKITTAADSTFTDQSAVYRVAAWDVGTIPIRLGSVRVAIGRIVQEIPLGDASVFVASVLPADTSLHVPKPARDVLTVPAPWWWWLLIAAAIAAILGLLWWWWRRRRRLKLIAVVDPYEEAVAAFDRVEKLGLLAAGERGRYVALMVEVVREYLSRIDPRADLALTTSELLSAIVAVDVMPANRLAALLVEADLIKFARRPVTAAHAAQLGAEARQVVDQVEEARQPAPAQAAA
ncbi:MAG TPA: DUF4381 family protein [Gemmatimonadaceae bacterium]|nr:DUF4381 family protein [Gemmatimonadaceae bacterium]